MTTQPSQTSAPSPGLGHAAHPPQPSPPPDPGTLPRPLTIFLTSQEHTLVRRALRVIHPDPAAALRRLLGIPASPSRR